MTAPISANTQAILLLTAPLILGAKTPRAELLTPGEYKRLTRVLRELGKQPADFLRSDRTGLLDACRSAVDPARMETLLGRGFQLGQALESWQARAIWVISRADPEYPRRLKIRLKDDAPALLYGCGEFDMLVGGGLAIVGSRNASEEATAYATRVGGLVASSGFPVVSGGAKGIDRSAMSGAIEEGGRAIGVLSDGLERAVVSRENRSLLMDGQLLLLSPFDPKAPFNVGNAMQRNKAVYAMADAGLVVSSDFGKGGTWTGAVEQLERYPEAPVYIAGVGDMNSGLKGLLDKGALRWPEPASAEELRAALSAAPRLKVPESANLELRLDNPSAEDSKSAGCDGETGSPSTFPDPNLPPPTPPEDEQTGERAQADEDEQGQNTHSAPDESPRFSPAERVFAAARDAIQQLAERPVSEEEVAAALDIGKSQAKAWLSRLAEEGLIEKRTKPIRYVSNQVGLFD